MQSLTLVQYQDLLTMLNSYLNIARVVTKPDASHNQASGTCFSISVSPALNSPRYWIVDSGATSHICFSLPYFDQLRSVSNVFVTLPNHSRIPVTHIGNVKISDHLILAM